MLKKMESFYLFCLFFRKKQFYKNGIFSYIFVAGKFHPPTPPGEYEGGGGGGVVPIPQFLLMLSIFVLMKSDRSFMNQRKDSFLQKRKQQKKHISIYPLTTM